MELVGISTLICEAIKFLRFKAFGLEISKRYAFITFVQYDI